MIDSGAGCSLITKGILRKLGKAQLTPSDRTWKDASQNNIKLIGKATLPVIINGINGEKLAENIEFYVSDSENGNCLLLGRNFMKRFGSTTFNFDRNEIRLGKTWCSGFKMHGGRVKLMTDENIPPRCEKLVKARWCNGNGLVTGDFMPSNLINTPGVYATKARVVPNTDGVFLVSLVNIRDEEVVVHKQNRIGKLTACHATVAEIEGTTNEQLDWTAVAIGDILVEDKNQILELLKGYEDVFAKNPKKPNTVNNATHKISTTSNQAVFRKPYPIPYAYSDDVNRQVEEMLENGIIRPSNSPWNAPVILVTFRV